MKKITLKEMLEELVKCILENKERPTFYWKCEYYSDKPEFLEITQIDLLDSRFKTFNEQNDFPPPNGKGRALRTDLSCF